MSDFINAAVSGVLRRAADQIQGAADKETAGSILAEAYHVGREILAVKNDGEVPGELTLQEASTPVIARDGKSISYAKTFKARAPAQRFIERIEELGLQVYSLAFGDKMWPHPPFDEPCYQVVVWSDDEQLLADEKGIGQWALRVAAAYREVTTGSLA